MALDQHQEAHHGWQADHRRQALPPSSSQAGYDFRPGPAARDPRATPLWLVAFVILGSPAALLCAWVML